MRVSNASTKIWNIFSSKNQYTQNQSNPLLDELEKIILVYMGSKIMVTRSELEQHTNHSGRTIGVKLKHLIELGLVRGNGNKYDPKQTYEIIE